MGRRGHFRTPRNPGTFHLLNAETLRLIPQGATLINISRGSVIEENALCELLEEEHFRGVALDVFKKQSLSRQTVLCGAMTASLSPPSQRTVLRLVWTESIRRHL